MYNVQLNILACAMQKCGIEVVSKLISENRVSVWPKSMHIVCQ